MAMESPCIKELVKIRAQVDPASATGFRVNQKLMGFIHEAKELFLCFMENELCDTPTRDLIAAHLKALDQLHADTQAGKTRRVFPTLQAIISKVLHSVPAHLMPDFDGQT